MLTEVLRQALPQWKVYGTDVSTIAIENAKKRYPHCIFFVTGEERYAEKKYDLLFTHHALEHVHDLRQVLDEMVACLKPVAGMLHILPCGNEGSFEHHVCLLRKDGIDRDFEGRFFFEDEGHVRRLNTEQISELCMERGFVLAREYYRCQYYGGIEWITRGSVNFVWMFTDTSEAVNRAARRELRWLRYFLGFTAIMRCIPIKFERKWSSRNKAIKDYIFLVVGLPVYICFLKPIDVYWRSKAQDEWNRRKSTRNGSEMMLYFQRRA